MKIRDKSTHAEDPPNLMPLIDMVFLLLIFFLVATTFAEEEREQSITLAKASTKQALSSEPNQLIINIAADGVKTVSGQVYSDEALDDLIRSVLRDEPGKKVNIRADKRSYMEFFARTAVLCQNAGIDRLNIGYLPDTPQE